MAHLVPAVAGLGQANARGLVLCSRDGAGPERVRVTPHGADLLRSRRPASIA